jgi:hypothetical protein
MLNRGYVLVKSSVAGADVYASWRERTGGQCVMVRQVGGRYASIVNVGPADCR